MWTTLDGNTEMVWLHRLRGRQKHRLYCSVVDVVTYQFEHIHENCLSLLPTASFQYSVAMKYRMLGTFQRYKLFRIRVDCVYLFWRQSSTDITSGPKFTILWRHVEEILLLNNFFPIVNTCLSCEDIARQICAMVPRWRFLATFLRPVFSASRAQPFQTCIRNLH